MSARTVSISKTYNKNIYTSYSIFPYSEHNKMLFFLIDCHQFNLKRSMSTWKYKAFSWWFYHWMFVFSVVWTNMRMFLNSKFHHCMLKCWILLKPELQAVYGNLQFQVLAHSNAVFEQNQSNQAWYIFNFVILGVR
jgi:hypothetical protein